jgi:ABC-2 type transport system permease protein
MSTLTYAVVDSRTMLRRNLRRILRYPSMTVMLVGMPIVFLLMFVYVFGQTLGDGFGQPAGGRAEYVNYVAPAIFLMTVSAAVQGTAISIAMDMTEGIIARFRTMAIWQPSVLAGHVIGSVMQSMISIAIVVGVAVLIGFRPNANALEWMAAAGLLLLFSLALIWLSVALGLKAKSVETASNTPMFLTLLPFLGSGFVPTDSMPAGLRWFAEYQPFTPVIETLRALLTGAPADDAGVALAWCIGIAVLSYVWSKRLFDQPRTN